MLKNKLALVCCLCSVVLWNFGAERLLAATSTEYVAIPPFVTSGAPPLVMLVMGRDHKLYYEAYNDASDLDGDGILETRYKPEIEYYGYFDSYKYYEYDGDRFIPKGVTTDKKIPDGTNYWSGDFLNYLTMSRIDVMRKVLYGGYRSTDTATETVLERAYIPNDAHCWGKEYVAPSGYTTAEIIAYNGYDISDYTPYAVPDDGRNHLFASGSVVAPETAGYAPLLRVARESRNRIWDWVTTESGNNIMSWGLVDGTNGPEMEVRVQVGVASLPNSKNEKLYTDTETKESVYKPTGILQEFGETGLLKFGLMSGSYQNHLSGGVLRKNIGSITDEINPKTGQFLYKTDNTVGGIIKTIDNLRIIGFNHSGNYWDKTIYSRPINEGENYMWGNPIGEMMYETLRYFAGESKTDAFNAGVSDGDDRGLDLPLENWKDPYTAEGECEAPWCAEPFMLVLSDINPSYDTNQLPGVYSEFADSTAFSGTLGTFDAEELANTIFDGEGITSGSSYYIGQSNTNFDTACSAKSVDGFGAIRGLCPEEPTKMGGYYSAAAAYYGKKNDISSSAEGDQNVTTYAVALASPLPRIEIPMGDDDAKITLVPFAKSVYSNFGGGVRPAEDDFQPTCAIVDFYVDELTDDSGKFTVTYEHAEQGSDFDLDATITYEYEVLSDTTVNVTLTSENIPGGSTRQHFGYIISGTTQNGVYLDIKNVTQSDDGDVDYYLDTPGNADASGEFAWNDGQPLPNTRTRSFTVDSAGATATLLENPLYYAAKWGGSEDKNGDNILQKDEWDKDDDEVPDTYFYVINPLRLEEQLTQSFVDILKRASSGTAASVISNTRSGDGAVYQSLFYPELKDSGGHTVSWVGEVHSLLVDAYGNMREDTNGNKKLDVESDAVVQYIDGQAYRFYDENGDGILQDIEKFVDADNDGTIQESEKTSLKNGPGVGATPLKYLWNSSDWLNGISDTDIVTQRSDYLSNTQQRYIFTWVDGDGDGLVNSDATDDEIKDFVWPSTSPSLADLKDTDTIYPYLHLYPSFNDKPVSIDELSTTDFQDFLLKETEREIKYIRGLDYVDSEGNPTPLSISGSAVAGTELRARRYEGQTWRLGDIAYSTPTAVGKPAEGYHLLYRDSSYADFVAQYEKRRTVIYAGANDGMLHAFNGGFYDSRTKQYCREINENYNPYDDATDNDDGCVADSDTTMPELGAELWAYIPFNLLPHLHWLTETEYEHSYYVDQKPRIFDAKIFPSDDVHPHGWGTVMVVGMRFGGASIVADIDKTDGAYNETKDPTMKSAFLIFDITNPEEKPELLGEIAMEKMGFATSYPTMVVMKDGDHDGNFESYSEGENRWFLAFGSGPADTFGDPAISILKSATSNQKAKFYMIDMVKLASDKEIWSLDGTGDAVNSAKGFKWYSELDDNSFVSDPITVDYDLDYNADVLYYGTVSTDGSVTVNPDGTISTDGISWGGKMRRIVIDDPFDGDDDWDPAFWESDSVLFDAGQPITAAATVALDDELNNWVFFGTGRYFVSSIDAPDTTLQSYYGIKEPAVDDTPSDKTWAEVPKTDLVDTTKYRVFTDTSQTVDRDDGTVSTWDDVLAEQSANSGWYIDFKDDSDNQIGERNLGQATLLGGALTFTTFIPSDDVCEAGGESYLWALYYKTGTAYYEGIIGTTSTIFDSETFDLSIRKVSLGKGLAASPNLHVGSEEGSKAFVQTSTGAIEIVQQENPYNVKSGMRSWKESD